jgi:hypothetical protein
MRTPIASFTVAATCAEPISLAREDDRQTILTLHP